jgi:Rha family phage regulatory protein
MNTQPELFPETLLVEVSEGRIYTNSLKIAAHFHKRHDNVVKIVQRVMEQSPAESLLNFKERLDEYETGEKRKAKRERTVIEMTEEGFAVVAMSFTGVVAMRWKWDFLMAFRQREEELAALSAELMQMKEREAAALYAIRPRWKPIVEHPDFKRAALISLTGHKSPASITACRRRMRQVGLLEGRTS